MKEQKRKRSTHTKQNTRMNKYCIVVMTRSSPTRKIRNDEDLIPSLLQKEGSRGDDLKDRESSQRNQKWKKVLKRKTPFKGFRDFIVPKRQSSKK
jgi:hypothetical protein